MTTKHDSGGSDSREPAGLPAGTDASASRSPRPASNGDLGERDDAEVDEAEADDHESAPTLVERPSLMKVPETESEADPEEKATELWAASAGALFPDEPRRRGDADLPSTPEAAPSTPEAAPSTPEAAPSIPEAAPATPEAAPARSAAAMQAVTERELVALSDEIGEGGTTGDPEDHDTDIISGEFQARPPAIGQPAGAARDDDTERVLRRDSVEISGEEAEAARRLAEEERARATEHVVPGAPGPDRRCRICGRQLAVSSRPRFRGPEDSGRGFCCEVCGNDFCAAHVERVSGLFSSLLRGGRFRCLLCQPQRTSPDPKG